MNDTAADRLANSWRTYDDDPEFKAMVSRIIGDFADALGESPEAWRGAEISIAFFAQMMMALVDDLDSAADADAIHRLTGTITAAFLDQPGARALRASRGA